MKFKLKQQKLVDLLEKLLVKDIFTTCVFSVKQGTLFSVEKEEHGRAMRFLKVNKNFFEDIDESTESIELNLEKTLSIVKTILPETELTFETKGNKVVISGKNVNANISFKEPTEILEKMPFETKDGVLHFVSSKMKDNIPLDRHFIIKLPDFKDIGQFANNLGTEFYKFMLDGKLSVRIGDLHDFSDYVVFSPETTVKSGKDLEVFFTYGIPQIAATFQQDVNVKTKTNSPGWFYESTDEYTLGVLIPPYVES